MLTTLSVIKPEANTRLDKLLNKLRKDKVEIHYKTFKKLSVKCVEYISYSKQVDFNKIKKAIGESESQLLCDSVLDLPDKSGYKRFDNHEFKERLCKNLCIELASKVNQNISIGVIDTDAMHMQLVRYLTKYTDCVTVVTKQIDAYKQLADTLLEETGAPIYITKGEKSLLRCELVVLLSHLNNNVQLNKSSVLLCAQKPAKDIRCLCIYDYICKLPKPLESLCPIDIDKTYFASALYSLCNVYQLGSVVPERCCSDIGLHTVDSLEILLENMNTKT